MYFGIKDQIGVDAESGLAQTVRGTSCNVKDVDGAPKDWKMPGQV
jgi:hypothetical protein